MPELGVNIDHVATVRQARGTFEPDPVWAAALCQLGGADGITIHLREDRRHIQERDVRVLKQTVTCKLNLEIAIEEEVTQIALDVCPDQVCLVPEKREELTTEGGLDVVSNLARLKTLVDRYHDADILVSMFIDPNIEQIQASKEINADSVELHTGEFANAKGEKQLAEVQRIENCGQRIRQCGLQFHAGHGLTYQNVHLIAGIEGIQELNIGHSIIARSMMVGMENAVKEMKEIMLRWKKS